MSPKTRLGDEERRLMHLVPAPAVRLMKRRVLSRPGVNSLMVLLFHTPGLNTSSFHSSFNFSRSGQAFIKEVTIDGRIVEKERTVIHSQDWSTNNQTSVINCGSICEERMTPSPPSPTATIPLKETSGGGLAVKTGSFSPPSNRPHLYFVRTVDWIEKNLSEDTSLEL